MTTTISALDTASTEDLLRALMARLRVRLAQAAGGLEREGQVRAVADALAREGLREFAGATGATVEGFLAEHPATAPPPLPEGLLDFPFPLGLPMMGGGMPTITGMRIVGLSGGDAGGPAGDPLEALKGRLRAELRQVAAQLPGDAAGGKRGKGRKKGRGRKKGG